MPYSGAEVVRKHQAAIGRCMPGGGWAVLKCIVDEMQKEYKGGPAGAY